MLWHIRKKKFLIPNREIETLVLKEIKLKLALHRVTYYFSFNNGSLGSQETLPPELELYRTIYLKGET